MPEQYVTAEFPWVLVAEWSTSSPTVHGGFRTADGAQEAATKAWAGDPACTGYYVLLITEPPVPYTRPRGPDTED